MTHWTDELFVDNPGLFRPDLEASVEAADDEVADLLSLLDGGHDLRPGTALDVACGVGRHAVALAERGVTTTGVDISPEYVDRARELAADAGVGDATTFVEGDMRDLGGLDRYDLVTNLWTAFGYYDAETNREVLAELYDRVAPGGALVLELANKEGILADFDDDGVEDVGDHRLVETREYDPATSRMATERWVYGPDGDLVGRYDVDLRLYAPVELADLCRSAGFDAVSLYGGFDGTDLSRDSTRMLVVAERRGV